MGWIAATADGVRLTLKVQPRASGNSVGPVQNDELRIRVTAPPVDSAANEAVIKLLAKQLGVSKSALALVQGQTSRRKVIEIKGLSADQARRILAEGD